MRFTASVAFLLVTTPIIQSSSKTQPNAGKTPAYIVSSVELTRDAKKPLTLEVSSVDTLAQDGKQTQMRTDTLWARDSEGRIFNERRSWLPFASPEIPQLEGIEIADPVAETRTLCDIKKEHCYVGQLNPPPQESCSTLPKPESGVSISWVGLGVQTVEGIRVNHTREICTHAQKGWTSAIDFWSSPELGLKLGVQERPRRLPGLPETRMTVTKVSQSEPDPNLFAIPEGFLVERTK